jgi:methionyl-tRNA formyltransferase
MARQKLKIVFFGTPVFAATQLDAIVRGGYEVAAVVTAPDKPAGRGKKIKQSAVKLYAIAHQLNVLQPANLKDYSFIETLKSLQASVFVVVAFRMLPEVIWRMPPLGTFNLHASMLPHYRGAAPINWAIINGETNTGLTTFFLNEKIDEGEIILQRPLAIYPEDDAGSLHNRMMTAGQSMVISTLELIAGGNVNATNQVQKVADMDAIKKAPKIFRADCRINWELTPVQIHNHIRGLSPSPGAFTEIFKDDAAIEMKIFDGVLEACSHQNAPFGLVTDNQNSLKIALPGGFYHITRLQLAGKKAMAIDELLRGYKFVGHWKVL